jgi:predicted DNA-binding transcriptional regulator AlpA
MAIYTELNAIGRLRAKDVIGLLRVSKSTFYQGVKDGRYPKPDGRDGSMVYWRAETIRTYLTADHAINCAGGES